VDPANRTAVQAYDIEFGNDGAFTATNSEPRLIHANNVNLSNGTTGGLITAGCRVALTATGGCPAGQSTTASPLQNQQFGANGALSPFGGTLVSGQIAANADTLQGALNNLAINYRTKDFVAEVKAFTGGKGVNVVLDMVGGPYVQRNMECAGMDARLVQIAYQQGFKIAEFDMRPISSKRLVMTGSTLRPRTVEQKAAIADSLRERVWPLLNSGKIKPIIDSTYPLSEASKAHARMETSAHVGKIVLTVV
jgi:hypothetical protein